MNNSHHLEGVDLLPDKSVLIFIHSRNTYEFLV